MNNTGRFPYQIQSKYPHMKPADILLWEKFVQLFTNEFDSVDFDVRVGEGIKMPEETPENMKLDAKVLTQKKIDVVGYNDDKITIIEVKPRAGTSALGQLISYKTLYEKTYSPILPIEMLIITDETDDDFTPIFEQNKIRIIKV